MRVLTWFYNQPYLLLFFATLFWAGNAIGGKLAVGHISPFLLTALRWLVAALIVLPIAYKHLVNDWALVRQRLAFLFVLAAIGFSLFNNLMYCALQTTTAMNVAIIQAALPASIFVLNFLFNKVSANKYQVIGFPLTVMGVIVVSSQGQWHVLSQLELVVGDALMLLAITFYGVYSVMLSKKPSIHWLSMISVLSISALVASLPFVVFEFFQRGVAMPDATAWIVVIYTAIFASLLSQVFWIRGIELIGSNAASLFINLVPILGTMLAMLLLNESFRWYHPVGLLLIISGVTLAQKNQVR